jgi:hypothetical protein
MENDPFRRCVAEPNIQITAVLQKSNGPQGICLVAKGNAAQDGCINS